MKEKTQDGNYSILKTLGVDFERKGVDERDEKRRMCDFRVAAIRHMVRLAITNFKSHLAEIDAGTYTKELIEDNDFLSTALHQFAVKNIYPQREIEQIELTGNSVIKGLLDILLDCAFNQDKIYRNHLKSVISKTFLKVAKREEEGQGATDYKFCSKEDIVDFDIEKLSPYSKLRTIVDLISGMTDRYAISMYQRLSGQKM